MVGILVAFFLIILVAGLKPKGFRLTNKVSWIEDRAGVRFNMFGIAFTDPFRISGPAGTTLLDEFSIEIALKPADYHKRRYKFVLVVHNGNDNEQLMIGQWLSLLIIMNGDDYDYERKVKRITLNSPSPSPTVRFLTIATGKEGTRLYVDGRLVKTQKDLTLKLPPGGNVRLVVGNSTYGKEYWSGDIYGLALYGRTLSLQEAADHYTRWADERSFAYALDDNPFAVWLFDEKKGTLAQEHAGSSLHLKIPQRMQIPDKQILTPPWKKFWFNKGFIIDIFINLLGFMPFGFILYAVLIRFGGNTERHGVLITVTFCFALSLSIEIFQAWIPSRSSYLLDLVLNTLGGFIGAITCWSFKMFRGKIKKV